MNWICWTLVIIAYFGLIWIIAQICGMNTRLEELEDMHPSKEDD